MTPLQALLNLKLALHTDDFEDAVSVALDVLKGNQCANCGCLLKGSERKRIEGKSVCAVCGEHIERLRR